MSYAGPAVLVGAPVGTRFNFNLSLAAVNVQIRYFSDEAGLVTIAGGTGSATLTATHSATMWRGTQEIPVRIDGGANVVSAFDTGILLAVPDGEWKELGLGGGAASVVITPSVLVLPVGALTYSIAVDAVIRT